MMTDKVQTRQGLVVGSTHDGIHRFLGLPYAAPPVGDRRWAPPEAPAAWEGVREALTFGPAAIQIVGAGRDVGAAQSEDCLYLNVWTSTVETTALQPVLLWIHGGGFLFGAASMHEYDGSSLARRGVTVVSINYRLGAFGFLTHKDIGNNFAVLDWVAALSWVRGNIESFGGDPGNVTVFGQSAGAAAGRTLLSTPRAAGLFHRVIMQSAGFEEFACVPSASYERAARATEGLLDSLGTHDIEALRQVPVKRVREASLELSGRFPPHGQVHTPANLVWHPVADGDLVERDLSQWSNDVPVMLGCTRHEARFFLRPDGVFANPDANAAQIYTQQTLVEMAKVLGGKGSTEILAHFEESGLSAYEALTELYSAAIWFEPALATLERFSGAGRRIYAYCFSRQSPGNRRSGLLAHHMAELPYVFGVMEPAEDYDHVDFQVSNGMQHAWVAFARDGVPRSPTLDDWPRYETTRVETTAIGDGQSTQPLLANPVVSVIRAQRAESPDGPRTPDMAVL